MEDHKIAVIFPGMGYHKDKPLLYYSTRLARNLAYEILAVEYHEMPEKVFDPDSLKKAGESAYISVRKQLDKIDFGKYDDILFIGKSIGTAAAGRYAQDLLLPIKQIWYTPIEDSFSFSSDNIIAFIGENDPASDLALIRKMAADHKVRLYTYPDCNHSLECDDVDQNLVNLRDVMKHTAAFMTKKITG